MFVALYEIQVREGCEADFERAWAILTEAIFRHRGSYGSRLHKTDRERVYVAYAQWPNRDTYDDPSGFERFTPGERQARQTMKDSADYVKTLHLMTVSDDRLRARGAQEADGSTRS